jgi:hypothetical protein
MLTQQLIKQINDFVYTKPRTIDEISVHIDKNWRTANSYVERIAEQQGTLSIRTFREGTRGALKIVFWNNIERIHSSSLQERLYKQIESGRRKNDFTPSEIYQYVDEKKKNALIMNHEEYTSKSNLNDFANFLRTAEKQVLFFSGNLTWSNLDYQDKKILEIVEELAKQGVSIKILTRVELPGLESIKNILAINDRIGRQAIEIRHCFQPLRATIIDSKSARFKEIMTAVDYPKEELGKDAYLLYEILDEEWIQWLQKVFWNLFRTSIDANKRIKEIEAIKKI